MGDDGGLFQPEIVIPDVVNPDMVISDMVNPDITDTYGRLSRSEIDMDANSRPSRSEIDMDANSRPSRSEIDMEYYVDLNPTVDLDTNSDDSESMTTEFVSDRNDTDTLDEVPLVVHCRRNSNHFNLVPHSNLIPHSNLFPSTSQSQSSQSQLSTSQSQSSIDSCQSRSSVRSMVSTSNENTCKYPNTCILLDWDDTLIVSNADIRSGVDLSPEDAALFKRHGDILVMFLETLQRFGHVYIVTNSEHGWVSFSCQKFLPNAWSAVQMIPIISARSTHECAFPDDPYRWKLLTFSTVITGYETVWSMGDAPIDCEATKNAVKLSTNSNINTKIVKFKIYPPIKILTEELRHVMKNVNQLHSMPSGTVWIL